MKRMLYLVHCGFYDTNLCDGIYESHVNFFVAASSTEEARANAKMLPDFVVKRMHIDGLQEISTVAGFWIELRQDSSLDNKTVIVSHRHRDLAPKQPFPRITSNEIAGN